MDQRHYGPALHGAGLFPFLSPSYPAGATRLEAPGAFFINSFDFRDKVNQFPFLIRLVWYELRQPICRKYMFYIVFIKNYGIR